MAFKERFRIDLRNILPYVHCLNHQLHLVVVNTIKWIPELATLSDTVNILHNFIKRPKISNLCKRLKLPRLMGQRWWGSFQYRCFCNRKSLQHCWFAKTCIEAILHQVRSKRLHVPIPVRGFDGDPRIRYSRLHLPLLYNVLLSIPHLVFKMSTTKRDSETHQEPS
ncbi:uncharacterized protein LOC106870892 [Octopus bimaculoides]|uniref:uncharacterized protein LOC106870892 n=1 Tax=Octopus bimaculoides TaxID=37653 RepID=UPI00071DC764|nr:uncharacterized protein LOC106870892 [Octopus bimaculoides]|eukprot:XP_014772614.1 PREDICTED: uncharacterized protein LOC106870892 [Octopus bimaculoides]